jgi:hypothetical protein
MIPSKPEQSVLIHSRLRFSFENFFAVEQFVVLVGPGGARTGLSQASLLQYVIAQYHYRVHIPDEKLNKNLGGFDTVIAKL